MTVGSVGNGELHLGLKLAWAVRRRSVVSVRDGELHVRRVDENPVKYKGSRTVRYADSPL
ncbi:MAG: hypothetical protein H5T86_13240 [Armatimonadetes bacterium]|nr:hypothetical protein [Armatimonadota bacterium]